MKLLLHFYILIPIFINAQSSAYSVRTLKDTGVLFERTSNWQEVLALAKKEEKFIFVDCYTTWCGPCKWMEKEVFCQKNVGAFMNQRFISVRVQMDSSTKDDESVKSWYKDADSFRRQFKINAFPTYLFFSPEGKPLHRYLSAIDDSLFIKVARNSLDPNKQYYKLLDDYFSEAKVYRSGFYLAKLARQIGDDSIANVVSTDYLRKYLDPLSATEQKEKHNLEFIREFPSIVTEDDRIFWTICRNGPFVDRLVGQEGFSTNLVVSVISKKYIAPILAKNQKEATDPDWERVHSLIRKKHDKYYSDLAIINAKSAWYRKKKDWPRLIQCTVEKFDRYGLDTSGIGWAVINNVAFDLFFKHCSNADTLRKMIRWMEAINKGHSDDQANMDTYANLLYKVGRNVDAINFEERAEKLEMETATREKRTPDPAYRETVEKMKKGVPTWHSKQGE